MEELSVAFFISFLFSSQPELFLFIILFFYKCLSYTVREGESKRAREREGEIEEERTQMKEEGGTKCFFLEIIFFGYLKGNHFNIGKFIKLHIHLAPAFEVSTLGSGGGTSGRVTGFCLTEWGSNPGTDLAFFRNAINLFSLGIGLSLKKQVIFEVSALQLS